MRRKRYLVVDIWYSNKVDEGVVKCRTSTSGVVRLDSKALTVSVQAMV